MKKMKSNVGSFATAKLQAKMRNILAIITLAALIGFSFTACSEENDPTHTHDYGDWTVTRTATCTAKGEETRVCTLDSTHKETREIAIDPNVHDYEWTVTKEKTCITEGLEIGVCKNDADHTTTRVISIDPTAHNWETAGIAPTCTETGNGKRKCKICELEETLNIIPALGHNYGNWTVTTAATCTTTGVETGTCSHDATHKETRTGAAALGHDYGSWIQTTAPTQFADAVETRTCTHDATHTETRSIPDSRLPFTSIANMKTWLDSQPANTASNPYNIKLNVSDLGGGYKDSESAGNALYINNTKYVSLDLSGSTFTSFPYLSIGANGAFSYCKGLTSITIPDSVTSIGSYAFYYTSLASITIPDSVTSIGSYAFGYTRLASVTIPNSVTSIGGGAFDNCRSLTSITIPNSVASIGVSAFAYCTSLASITIPNSVTFIGAAVFSQCSSLTSVTIPDNVTSIEFGAFEYCTNLNSVTIPDSVTSIGQGAFAGCTSLASIIIPNSVTSISPAVFSGCTSLTSITIPDSVTSIWSYAFEYTSLASITIPDSVTSIGTSAFSQCTSLTSVTFAMGSNIPNANFGNNAFPEGSDGKGGNTLKTAYSTEKAGTYTRTANGLQWRKTSD